MSNILTSEYAPLACEVWKHGKIFALAMKLPKTAQNIKTLA